MRIHVPPEGGREFTSADAARIAREVSEGQYNDHIEVGAVRQTGPNSVQLRLKVAQEGAFVGAAGVQPMGNGLYAPCYHAHSAVLRALYEEFPDARVTTGIARYIGVEQFESADRAMAPTMTACPCEVG